MLDATSVLLLAMLVAEPAAPPKSGNPGLILLHAAYGTPTAFLVTGRVVVDKGVRPADPSRGRLANAADALKALESDEIEGAGVAIEVAGARYQGTTDAEGNFAIEGKLLAQPLAAGWAKVRASLTDDRGHPAPEVDGRMLVIADAPGVAIISDFDDTVVESGVTKKAKLLYHSLTRNAAQLVPVPGVAAAYTRAAEAGAVGFFYVSGSPENFHERIAEFLSLQKIPAGPILLKNFSTEPMGAQQEYKQRRINAIFDALPKLRFVLIGDTGEKDPEIYRRVRDERPERVVAVVIRKVKGADNDAVRLKGMIALDDYSKTSDTIAAIVSAAGGQRAHPNP